VTLQILLVFAILLASLVLFIGGWIRIDLVALLVLAVLAISGLVSAREALSGFSSPAVVTVWAMFILSGGLARTGIAGRLGDQLLRVAGRGELRLVLVIMLTSAFLSAFMNNVGVAALLLPVVMDISRSTGIAPSRLLMPLAYSSLLGGLTTLIGTPPNILVSEALRDQGMRPFGLFDYSPVGGGAALVGVLFMAFVGRRLLPGRESPRAAGEAAVAAGAAAAAGAALPTGPPSAPDLEELYELHEELFTIPVAAGSPLVGKPLAESRFGAALDLNVVAILRNGETLFAPGPEEILRSGDRLLVQGSPERLAEFRGRRSLQVSEDSLAVERLTSADVDVAEARVLPGATLVGQALREVDFRGRFGLNVLAIEREGSGDRRPRPDLPLEAGDRLLVQGASARIEALRADSGFEVSAAEHARLYHLAEQLFALHVTPDSVLAGKSLAESRLGGAFGLSVLSILREGRTYPMPDPEEKLRALDTLIVSGRPEDTEAIESLRELEVERAGARGVEALRSERVGLVEAVLAPRTALAGSSLRELHFRIKYGLTVLAIMRQGEILRERIADIPLRFGDALLLYGPAERLRLLGAEPDFLVLTRGAQEAPRTDKAPIAALLMGLVIVPVLLGWVPIYIAAVAGASLMVLTGCLTMDEAYRDIEWPAVFLIAGMLPLGIALDRTGGAALVAEQVVSSVGQFGPVAVMAGLFALTSAGTQIIPTAALVVLMAPIVLNTAAGMGISPYALMMTVAMAASASFGSPVSHPANVLVMGPGGYRFTDYVRVGMPLTLAVFVMVILLTPIFWPLYPG
jgi:di/tricarboxylate transporter